MAKRFYDTGLPDQLWYQKLTPKCKALYLHLLCKCDVAGTFEINYPMFSAYVGDTITENDVFSSFGNRIVPLMKNGDKGILVDFVYFQCGGELNSNVKAHQSIFRRLEELGITVEELQSLCTHELKCYNGVPKNSLFAKPPTVNGATVGIDFGNDETTSVTIARVKPVKKAQNKSITEMFDVFYREYPRHDSKQVAMLKFAKVMNDCKTDEERQELLQKMLKAVDVSKTSDQWTKDGGKYIPMPATWINQRRWEDEGLVSAPTACQKKEDRLANAFAKALTI